MSSHAQSSRFKPLDALRGLLMALMALDHTSQFVAQKHSSGEMWGGSFPAYRDALAFLTRLVTHPCAPGLAFLMGVSMLLFARSREARGWSRWAIVRHFWLRGAVLIVLKFVLVNRTWELSPGGWGIHIYVGVLFALACGMMLGSLLLWLKPWHLIALSVSLTACVEWWTPDPSKWLRSVGLLPRLLWLPGGDSRLWVNYPVLPWLALVILGMAFGQWMLRDPGRAYRRALGLGAAFLLAFLPLRYLNGFGNIRPWYGNDWITFLNVVKYPPSATFMLLTMGANLLLLALLAWAAGKHARLLRPLVVLGQVPLFFYVTHLFLYAAMGRLLTPHGTTIVGMYPYWLLGLVMLYPLCLWYGRLKDRQPAGSWLHLL